MADLLNAVLDAHGGLDHWRQFSQVGSDYRYRGRAVGHQGPTPGSTTEADDRCVGPRVGVASTIRR